MRYFLLFISVIAITNCRAQNGSLLKLQNYFDEELKPWTATFNRFSLGDFKTQDTLPFDNNYRQDLNNYKQFLSIYKPIITFSSDGTAFVDIYSYQLNLEKKDTYYQANPDIDQAIILYNSKNSYWNRIYFGTSSMWIDEVIWISESRFILVGIYKPTDNKRLPFILLGDVNKQTLIRYIDASKNSFQTGKVYMSPKLGKIKIKGL